MLERLPEARSVVEQSGVAFSSEETANGELHLEQPGQRAKLMKARIQRRAPVIADDRERYKASGASPGGSAEGIEDGWRAFGDPDRGESHRHGEAGEAGPQVEIHPVGRAAPQDLRVRDRLSELPGPLRLVGIVKNQDVARKILTAMHLPAAVPELHPARPPPAVDREARDAEDWLSSGSGSVCPLTGPRIVDPAARPPSPLGERDG